MTWIARLRSFPKGLMHIQVFQWNNFAVAILSIYIVRGAIDSWTAAPSANREAQLLATQACARVFPRCHLPRRGSEVIKVRRVGCHRYGPAFTPMQCRIGSCLNQAASGQVKLA